MMDALLVRTAPVAGKYLFSTYFSLFLKFEVEKIKKFKAGIASLNCFDTTCLERATTRYLYVVCIYGSICLQILYLKNNILLFCHESLISLHELGHNILKSRIFYFVVKKIAGSGGQIF
jgi:hypothetical protein